MRRRPAWWSRHWAAAAAGVVVPFRNNSNMCSRVCPPKNNKSPDSLREEKKNGSASSKAVPTLSLNVLSTSVRRLLENSPPGRCAETPGLVDALLTILLKSHHDNRGGGGGGENLHPLLGVEILKEFGFALWINDNSSTLCGGGWARRSGLSSEDLAKVVRSVLVPLLPHTERHPKVRPLLPVLVEWLVCISDIPLTEWLPQLSLYLDGFASLNVHDMRVREQPSPGFILQYMSPKLLNEAMILSPEVCKVLDRMLQLLVKREIAAVAVEKKSTCDAFSSILTCSALTECMFWQGEVPLLLQNNIIREAYIRFYHFTLSELEKDSRLGEMALWKKESQPLLLLPAVDDDVFRRLLLRLLLPSSSSSSSTFTVTEDAVNFSLESIVLVEPFLHLEDPSVIVRFIKPLSEFVSVVLDGVFSSSLQLSFNGIRTVIYNAIGELQKLQKGPQSPRYPLLPHKPRIHTLKALCDRLYSDVERKLKYDGASATFPGIPLQEQLRILYGFCYATRRLVRAVQEEKRKSLLEEGPEGPVLQAGGAVSKYNDVTDVLRNTAFRVLEVSLLRYYNAVENWSCSPVIVVGSGGEENDGFEHVRDALDEIDHHAGNRATFFTARHLLQHPLCHNVTATVEALRIVAIQGLLSPSPHCREWLKTNFTTKVIDAFFGVWHQTMKKSLISTVGGELNHEKEEVCSALWETPEHLVSLRLLWTMLLLHQNCCSCGASVENYFGTSISSVSNCAVFRSLLDLLTFHGTCTEFSTFGSLFPFHDAEIFSTLKSEATVEQEEREKHEIPQLYSRRAADYSEINPSFIIGKSLTRWKLLEELISLGGGGDNIFWRWLGTPRAVWEVVSGAAGKSNNTTVSTSSHEHGVRYAGYLLPWTTVAQSRHPLRLYDESGQSSAAASAFDAALGELLRLQGGGPLLRFVSLTEETALFCDISSTPELVLGSGVTVVHLEAHPMQQQLQQRRAGVGVDESDSNSDVDDDNLD